MNWTKVIEVLRTRAKIIDVLSGAQGAEVDHVLKSSLSSLADALEAGLEEEVTIVSQSPIGELFECDNYTTFTSCKDTEASSSDGCTSRSVNKHFPSVACPLAKGKQCSHHIVPAKVNPHA